MNHATIQGLFYISMVLGLGLGALLFYYKAKQAYDNIKEKDIDIHRDGLSGGQSKVFMYAIPYLLPAVIAFAICCIPMFYFHNLLKRENYCIEIIKVNEGIEKDDEFIQQRCRGLDIDELFERAQKKQ